MSYLGFEGTAVLPQGFTVAEFNQNNVCPVYSDDSDEEWLDDDDSAAAATTTAVEVMEFPKLLETMKEAIEKLGGVVFPKLGWSSPRDADWQFGNSMKCRTPGEIVLLLKSSDFAAHDLLAAYALCEDADSPRPSNHELVLRRWNDLSPASEFRCFIKESRLVAVSQRQHKQHFKHIAAEKDRICEEIVQFVNSVVIGKFPSQSYVVDLYRSIETRQGFLIVDFNPFCTTTTESLLFDWSEIESETFQPCKDSIDLMTSDGVCCGKFRYAGAEVQMQPSDFLCYGMPTDFIDLSNGTDPAKLVDFCRMKIQTEEDWSSDDDEQWKLPDQN